ncbi:hypothetical protein [[Mycobacterium] fortunisiensis]|uniref:hypothetical protein n=1 Tax=[Mycobacterium] fortunisiensis TaxID=2600579 RepID=UPI001C264EB0|nr:hypothetical protein [[Mycobacterium] fortunisiensis]
MDEYAEDLPELRLPTPVEEYLVGEREWHRLLRGTGAVSEDEAREQLARWMET